MAIWDEDRGKWYPFPILSNISDISSHSFKINIQLEQGTNYETPHHYELDVYCFTPGASFEMILGKVIPPTPPYYIVDNLWGGEEFAVFIYAVYFDETYANEVISDTEPLNPVNNMYWFDTSVQPAILKRYNSSRDEWETQSYNEVERLPDIIEGINTPLIPITAIELPVGVADNITMSTAQVMSNSDYMVENLIIRPSIAAGDADNASVLDGTRQKAIYTITGNTDAIYITNGAMWAKKRGVCNVNISPADNQGGTPLNISVTVTQAVENIEITPNYIQIQLSGGTLALDTVKVLPDDANNKALHYASDDTSILTVDNDGVITPVSAGVTTITVTADDPDYRESKKLTVEVISAANIWHDNYDVCPIIMNTVDFNSIIDNIAYIGSIANLTGLTPPTLQKATPNDAFVLSKGKFEAAFNYVKYVLENSTTYSGFTGDTSQIKTSFIYAPTYSEWNVLLSCINDAKAYVESN